MRCVPHREISSRCDAQLHRGNTGDDLWYGVLAFSWQFDADGDGKLNFREWQEFAEQDELVLEFLDTMGTVLPDT